MSFGAVDDCSCGFDSIGRFLQNFTGDSCRNRSSLLLKCLLVFLIDVVSDWLDNFFDFCLEAAQVYAFGWHLVVGLRLLLLLHGVLIGSTLRKYLFEWHGEVVLSFCFGIRLRFGLGAHFSFGLSSKQRLEGRGRLGLHLGLTLSSDSIDLGDILICSYSQEGESDSTHYVPILHFCFIIISRRWNNSQSILLKTNDLDLN